MSTVPHESISSAEMRTTTAVFSFLRSLGVDTEDEHLERTPSRVARAWRDEFLSGYKYEPKDVLIVEFDSTYDQMVIVDDIRFYSFCAHHLVPFHGTCRVGYVPNGKITGLSKLCRLVDIYARRLQVQERMTDQIAHALWRTLECKGVGVITRAEHMCIACRGVMKSETVTITSSLLGCMRDEPETRAEFLDL